MKISDHDVFINVAGGVKVSEPAADLGVALAMASSFKNRALPEDTVCFGEMGLTGEVRAVSRAAARLLEAQKLGFGRAIAPRSNAAGVESFLEGNEEALSQLRFEGARDLGQALRAAKLIDSASN